MGTFVEYEQYDATGLADLMRAREVSADEVLDAAILRVEQHNAVVNAVVTTAFDRARNTIADGPVDGPFRGVPYLFKGLGHAWSGVRLTGGSRALRDHVPTFTSTLVHRLEAAGLVGLGMTNVPELGIRPVTEPELHGVCANPWDPTRTAGGSSGGAAAAVAVGMVPAASASDGGGSIRIPASHCGLFGLKPTRARTPSGPVGGEGLFGLSVGHALTRTVRDSAALLDVTMGPEPGDPYAAPPPDRLYVDEVGAAPGALRIGVIDGGIFHDDIDPQCRAAVAGATTLVSDLGHEVTPLRLDIDVDAAVAAMLVLVAASTAASVAEVAQLRGQIAPEPTEYELTTWALRQVGRALGAEHVAAAFDHVRVLGRAVAAQMERERIDMIMTSTMASPPTRHRALDPSPSERRVLEALQRIPVKPALLAVFRRFAPTVLAPIPSLPLFNMTGQPAMSVPLHWTPDGLPVGIQFVGRFGDEAALLRLAGQLETAQPWFDRRPPLAAATSDARHR